MREDATGTKEFVQSLILELRKHSHHIIADELSEWNKTTFTTSSEFLGELRIILRKAQNISGLDKNIVNQVAGHVRAIDNAFGA
jgi:hypothetical protein